MRARITFSDGWERTYQIEAGGSIIELQRLVAGTGWLVARRVDADDRISRQISVLNVGQISVIELVS